MVLLDTVKKDFFLNFIFRFDDFSSNICYIIFRDLSSDDISFISSDAFCDCKNIDDILCIIKSESKNVFDNSIGYISDDSFFNDFIYKDFVSKRSLLINKYVDCIRLQSGARNDINAIRGFCDCDLLEIVKDRLLFLQKSELACKENRDALVYIENALKSLNGRSNLRFERFPCGRFL